MRKFHTVFALFSLVYGSLVAQSVGINTTGVLADASAMLDVSSVTKGFLAPRMTLAQRGAIVTPATGLLIYQTDGTAGFWYYDGTTWVNIGAGGSGWGLLGNAGTVSGTNFIGTTDAQNLDTQVSHPKIMPYEG